MMSIHIVFLFDFSMRKYIILQVHCVLLLQFLLYTSRVELSLSFGRNTFVLRISVLISLYWSISQFIACTVNINNSMFRGLYRIQNSCAVTYRNIYYYNVQTVYMRIDEYNIIISIDEICSLVTIIIYRLLKNVGIGIYLLYTYL